jgi:hypothetical protein
MDVTLSGITTSHYQFFSSDIPTKLSLEYFGIYFILRMIFFSISNITFMENLLHQINDSGDVFSLSLSLS